jgi:hypothetical protein
MPTFSNAGTFWGGLGETSLLIVAASVKPLSTPDDLPT